MARVGYKKLQRPLARGQRTHTHIRAMDNERSMGGRGESITPRHPSPFLWSFYDSYPRRKHYYPTSDTHRRS